MKRLSAILVMMILLLAVPMETFAVSRPSKVKKLISPTQTATDVTIKWSKARGAKGYEVQQYNSSKKRWETVKKVKSLRYIVGQLTPNTSYRFRVRAYNSYKKYYNTKTKKWQNRKPASKNWKAKTVRNKYVYGKFSKTLTVKTRENASENSISSGNKESNNSNNSNNSECSHIWSDWHVYVDSTRTTNGTERRWCTVCYKNEYRELPLKPADPYGMPIDSWIGQRDDGYVIGDKITLTDYAGDTRTFIKTSTGYWKEENGWTSLRLTDRNNLAMYCKDVDGTFSASGLDRGDYIQKNGVAILAGELDEYSSDMPYAKMFNGDEEKLQIVIKNQLETFDSYTYDKEPCKCTYVMKDGYRLTPYYGIKTEHEGKAVIKSISLIPVDMLLHNVSCGFVSGEVVADVVYDGQIFGQIKKTVNRNADADGFSEGRRNYLNVALAAVNANGGPKNYTEDMRAIKAYIGTNYKYGEKFGPSNMTCAGGAGVLDTYSIYKYGVYGFFGYGSQSPGSANYGYHVAFHPDTRPPGYSGSKNPPDIYYEAQGSR